MKYLIVDDQGNVFKTDNITEEDIDACDAGRLSAIIDTETQTEHLGGDVWIDILLWE